MAVPRLPKFGPGNGTVFGACGKCANTKGPQKRVRNPDPLLAPFSHKLALSSELLNLEIRNKTAENKSLGKVMTSYAELQQAAVADEQVGNNDRQQKLCSCAFTSPTSEEGTPALWRPLVHGNVFEQFSTPQNRPLIWLVVATLGRSTSQNCCNWQAAPKLQSVTPSSENAREKHKLLFGNECNILS